jgi:hypothetical protein
MLLKPLCYNGGERFTATRAAVLLKPLEQGAYVEEREWHRVGEGRAIDAPSRRP